MTNDELVAAFRKLAEELRTRGDQLDQGRTKKAAHILAASKALVVMGNKRRGWYEQR